MTSRKCPASDSTLLQTISTCQNTWATKRNLLLGGEGGREGQRKALQRESNIERGKNSWLGEGWGGGEGGGAGRGGVCGRGGSAMYSLDLCCYCAIAVHNMN